MGIGMQIVYLGFAGAAPLEAEAGAQLVRLARFGDLIANCHLVIEALPPNRAGFLYDVRLDLITPTHDLKPIAHCAGTSAEAAIRGAFDLAEKELQIAAANRHTR
ncbi:HPF/RaiA family ribosome-associated protein [Paraburkholderia sp. ZP32-5]|uniref:HPF/RaiA family ribosome-associated protein n=1 Tax=Paraburkholderia sp. ZP32-5 TaxID=2883245 RepID=UPI001F294D3D|nr:HPF/RaiA family ribosome-associated protein [Paraburkholderia sp. ZP32-5]